jgi:MoaA/NifB/PqqE/SkfB family radical SAM enzyme
MHDSGVKEALRQGRSDLLGYASQLRKPLGYVAGQVELTSACEQQCGSCQSWLDHRSGAESGEWRLADLKEFHADLACLPTFETLALTGGDPQSYRRLSDFLRYHQGMGWPFRLRMNTALPMPIEDPQLWREALHDIRVSLDGVDRDYYRKMRGVATDPREIIDRMVILRHPQLSTLTCVSQKNIDHVPDIVRYLQDLRQDMPLRKAIFIPIRDMNDKALIQLDLRPVSFQERWQELQLQYAHLDWTSFGEQVGEGELAKFKGVKCHVSGITFHAKSNGDLYTCCLMGGEAIATRKEFRIGNLLEDSIEDLWHSAVHSMPTNVYDDPESPCTKICLWKQATMNLIGHETQDVSLAMP